MQQEMKSCSNCKRALDVSMFYRDSRKRDGLQSQCNACRAAYAQSHRPERAASDIKRRYGLTPFQYKALVANGCVVCGTMENLHIDHDHSCCPGENTCGKCVRGVLCGGHNHALGNVHDSIDELMSLAAYLLQSKNVLGVII